MSYPRAYPITGGGGLNEHDYNALRNAVTGITINGVRAYPFDYLIRNNGGVYEAIDSHHNLVYGGSDSANGISGATLAAVWQACIDANRENKHIHLQGNLTLASTVDMTNCHFMTFSHSGGILTIESNDVCLFDLTGAYRCNFSGFYISISTDYSPTCIFLMARNSTEYSAGSHLFFNIDIYDYAGPDNDGYHTTIYSYGSEVNTYIGVSIYIRCTAFVITGYNLWSLTSSFETIATGSQSCLQNLFTHGTIQNNNFALEGGLSSKVIIDAGGNHVFANSFFGSFYSYLFEIANTGDGFYGLWLRDSRIEGKLLKCSAGAVYHAMLNFTCENNWFDYGDREDYSEGFIDSSPGTYFFDSNYTNNAFRGAVFRNNAFSYGRTYTLTFWQLIDSDVDFTNYGSVEPYVTVANLYRGRVILHNSDHWSLTSGITGEPTIVFTEDGAAQTTLPPNSIMFYSGTGRVYNTMGTSYIEVSTYFRSKIDFTYYRPKQMRLIMNATGGEAGSNKGVKIVLGTVTIEHLWDGSSNEAYVSDWTDISGAGLSGYTVMSPYGKGSSGSENMTFYHLEVQFR
jgi:hypothetical protein